MSEAGGSNIEIAHHLSKSKSHTLGREALEIVEAFVLAVVAISTAWSGYQAALWSGHQAKLYGEADRLRVQAQGFGTLSNQEQLFVAITAVEWLKAKSDGQENLATLLEKRILPEFRPAFDAWKKSDPIHNPNALPGPLFMPEYKSPKAEHAANLEAEAAEIFKEGTTARERSDDYVRVTVTLASVLLLTSISQQFKDHRVRIGLIMVAMFLLGFPLYSILTMPRA